MKWAVLFDWDGIIVDSSSYHEESWERLAEEEGKTLPPNHFKKGFGMRNQAIIPNLLGWASDPEEIDRLSLRKEELYRVIVQEKGLSPLPGVQNLLSGLHKAGIPCAVASSTPRKNITFALKHMGMKDTFDCIVAGEDVENGKPAPEVFLKAARSLGMPPQQCIVFEDAHVGIEAARKGKFTVVAASTTHPKDTLQDADKVIDCMGDIAVNELEALLNGTI